MANLTDEELFKKIDKEIEDFENGIYDKDDPSIIEWDYAMSGVELEELRSDANHFSIKLTSLMRENGLHDKNKKNNDLIEFWDLTDKVWMEYSKEKSYDECFKILETKFNEILKKYDLELK